MANDPHTTAEREPVPDRDRKDLLGQNPSSSTSSVNIYDRPATTKPALGSTVRTILSLVVILLLAYFVFQWLF